MYEATKAEYVEKLAPGFQSTKGLGKTEPDAALPPAPPPPPPPPSLSQNGSAHSNNEAHSPLNENNGKIIR